MTTRCSCQPVWWPQWFCQACQHTNANALSPEDEPPVCESCSKTHPDYHPKDTVLVDRETEMQS